MEDFIKINNHKSQEKLKNNFFKKAESLKA